MTQLPFRAIVSAVQSWAAALGSQLVPIEKIEEEFRLASGTLADGASLETLARVADGESETSLGAQAAETALGRASLQAKEIDLIVATGETHVGTPSLGAALHGALRAPDTCGVLDVGGACMGALNAFATAKAFLESGMARRVLVVTADVHSRLFSPGRVDGKFGGLFGDGASAFVLGTSANEETNPPYRVGEILAGCTATHASALKLQLTADNSFSLTFEGESLGRAAVRKLARIIAELEARSGVSRQSAAAFALHQPNPRLVEMVSREAGVPAEKMPVVGRRYGNLGASTCGVGLAMALEEHGAKPAGERGAIFFASLGPGLLWGGTVLT